MRCSARLVVVGFAVVLCGVGCSGTSGDGGGTNGDGTSDEGPGNYMLVGTCDVREPSSASTCAEYWHVPNEDLQTYSTNLDATCGEDWIDDEAECPTSGDYVGTCVATTDETKEKVHHYNTDRVAVLRSGCEAGDNQTWKVE